MPLTQYYVDPALAANVGTGAIGDPFGDLQYALNTAVRDAVNGDQFNVKAGTDEILTASLSLAIYGIPTVGAPLVFRGYTAVANDGGIGSISGAASFSIFNSATLDFIHWYDMKLYNTGANLILRQDQGGSFINCEFASNTNGYALTFGAGTVVLRCYFHSVSAAIYAGASLIGWNYFTDIISNVCIFLNGSSISVIGNIFRLTQANTMAVQDNNGRNYVIGNTIFNSTAGTGQGYVCSGGAANNYCAVLDNIFIGFSGAGGDAVDLASCRLNALFGNAYYNNTNNETSTSLLLFSGDNTTALAALPFVDQASGDFSLTVAGKAVLRDIGWPSVYLGAHVNTDTHLTIGPIQYGPAVAGGAVSISPWRGNL